MNGTDRFAWTSVPAKSAKPAPTMSAPVHRSRRRDEATRPAETNETPATIVKAASAGLVATKLAPLDRRRGQHSTSDGGGADADHERV